MSADVRPLVRVVVKHARDAFVGPDTIAREWRDLNYLAAPDFSQALEEYDAFLDLMRGEGVEILELPSGTAVGLDALYARDASIWTPDGMILGRMGKTQRAGEPAAQREAFDRWGIRIAGSIASPGRLEGGDVVWLNDTTLAVGRGYRTNDAGIAELRAIVGDGLDVVVVPLVHGRGPADVFHLMSIISPVDVDLAVVYAPLLPVPFVETLSSLGYRLIEVPDDEFRSMGTNVLALAPGRVLMLEGNPVTNRRLREAGVTVLEYRGAEISVKGGGGPTCLTRPVSRRGDPIPRPSASR